jgi:hypothetical protein
MDILQIKNMIHSFMINPNEYTLTCYCSTSPVTTKSMTENNLILSQLSHICLSLPDRVLHVDGHHPHTQSAGQNIFLGYFTVERVGDLPTMHHRQRAEYFYTHPWYQHVRSIGISPNLHMQLVPSHASYCFRFARNTVARVTDVVKQSVSTSTVHDIQLLLEEVLSNTFHHQIVFEDSQLHFLDCQPILAMTNICRLVTGNATIAIQVLSKSPLITTDDSEVTRFFFGQCTIQQCTANFPGREQTPLINRREQTLPPDQSLSIMYYNRTLCLRYQTVPGPAVLILIV